LQFEWDENKRLKTLRERGIDFIDMVALWDDPNRQERGDNRRDYGEARIQTIGAVQLHIYFVVYVERFYDGGEEVVRIVSARRATRRERDLYARRQFAEEAAE
jgi:uncharacterized DUF497 family protein